MAAQALGLVSKALGLQSADSAESASTKHWTLQQAPGTVTNH